MPLVILERNADEPQDVSQLQAREASAAWCFSAQRVRPLRTFVARDKRHVVSLYDAPDAEAVRATQRSAGLSVSHAWAALPMYEQPWKPLPTGYSLVIAQRAMPDHTTVELVQHLLTDPTGCGRRLRIQQVGSYLSRDLRRMCCCYASPDLESVRIANREAGVPFERVWSTDVLENVG